MKKFNLIATTPRGQENLAAIELEDLLKFLGDESPKVSLTSIAGLLTAKTNLDPFEVVDKVRKLIEDEPWRVVNLRRLIPIEEVVESSVEEISQVVERLSSKIPENATFRITIEKRHTSLSSSEIIEMAAKKVNRKVNLKSPDWIVLIEVIGPFTGVSVIRPEQILSTSKIQK